jgi:pSer/pThr/pTyr-binding forkhead associated (FHA) protein
MKNQTATTNGGQRPRPSPFRPAEKLQVMGRDPVREANRVGLSLGMLVRRDNGQGFRIREEVVIIGRNYDCDIRIEKPYVSRVHAVVCRENGSLVLEDLGGKNGTRVNRVAVSRKVLADGDRILIGRAELVFRSG